MAIILARRIGAVLARIADHHADMADLDDGLRDHFDRREQPVDEIAALDQHLELAAAAAAGGDELLRILEAVVEGRMLRLVDADFGRDDVIGGQRRAVMDGDDADLVGRILDHHRGEALALLDQALHLGEQLLVAAIEHQSVDMLARDDHELGEVYGIGALAQDRALRALLAARGEKRADIEEIGGLEIARERLRRPERGAVAREDVADLALRDRHERLGVDAILERHEEMIAAAQDLRLIAGLAIERDQAAGDGAAATPQFLDDGDTVIADIAYRSRCNEKKNDNKRHGDRCAEQKHVIHVGKGVLRTSRQAPHECSRTIYACASAAAREIGRAVTRFDITRDHADIAFV